ncbi:MAG TPA: helix-turn-helix domain-containing protein [Candidatus Dormibacteraeota bacterium]|nr:helix-turn-helix domain-containing protein [Candidatus Dormibacteraeota bacterium]
MSIGNERATVTVNEAARILGIGRAAAYEGVRAGRIPSIRISPRRIVVPRAALDRLLGMNAPAGTTHAEAILPS